MENTGKKNYGTFCRAKMIARSRSDVLYSKRGKSLERRRITKESNLLVFAKNTGGCFFFNKIEQIFVTGSGSKTKIRTCVPAIFVLYCISESRKHVFRCRLGWFFLLIFENMG